MEEYENNSLHNCTDENELDSQPSPAEDFAAPQEDPTPEAEPCWTPDAKEEPKRRNRARRPLPITMQGPGGRSLPLPILPM